MLTSILALVAISQTVAADPPQDSASRLAVQLNKLTDKPVILSLSQGRGKLPDIAVVEWDKTSKESLAQKLDMKLSDEKAVIFSPNETVKTRYTNKGAISSQLKKLVEPVSGLESERLESGYLELTTPAPLSIGVWQLEELPFKTKPKFHWWTRSHILKIYLPKPVSETAFLEMVAQATNATYTLDKGRCEIDLDPAEHRREWTNFLMRRQVTANALGRGIATTALKALPNISDAGIYGLMAKFRNTPVEKKFAKGTVIHETAWQFMKVFENVDDVIEDARDPDNHLNEASIEYFRKQRAEIVNKLDPTKPVKVVFETNGVISVYIPNQNGISYNGFLVGNQMENYAPN